MSRGLRIYEKKRGHRRTGSSKLGLAGEAAFFAVLLLAGGGGLVGLLFGIVFPEWRTNHEFIDNTCVVLDKRLAERDNHEDGLFRPEIKIRYTVDGRSLTAWTYDIATATNSINSFAREREAVLGILERFERGQQYPCWYDPQDSEVVVLVRGYGWWVAPVLAWPILLVLVGAGGLLYSLLHWCTSVERRAMISRRGAGRELLGQNGNHRCEFPTVPEGSDITNSPGTKLRYRLPVGTSPGWALFGILATCVAWNGVVGVFLVMAIDAHLAGNPDWVMTVFLSPFVVVGVVLVAALIRRLLMTTGVGPTHVELSDHPLRPGSRYDLFVAQSGRLPLNEFEVQLHCEEQASYREGTNSRTEVRKVFSQRLYRGEGLGNTRRAEPFQVQCELQVPDQAMHSFRSEHNAITWRLVVEGRVAGWPCYRRDYPVIVCPAEQTNGHE